MVSNNMRKPMFETFSSFRNRISVESIAFALSPPVPSSIRLSTPTSLEILSLHVPQAALLFHWRNRSVLAGLISLCLLPLRYRGSSPPRSLSVLPSSSTPSVSSSPPPLSSPSSLHLAPSLHPPASALAPVFFPFISLLHLPSSLLPPLLALSPAFLDKIKAPHSS